MIEINSERETLLITLHFQNPILEKSGFVTQFMNLIYRDVGRSLNINASDFFVKNVPEVGNAHVEYRIFGGQNTIRMYISRLEVSFSNIVPSDYQILVSILKNLFLGFAQMFAEQGISLVNVLSLEHASLASSNSANQVELNLQERSSQFDARAFSKKLKTHEVHKFEENDVIFAPIANLSFQSKEKSWNSSIRAERSELIEKGVFLRSEININDSRYFGSFEEIFEIIRRVNRLSKQLSGFNEA